MGPFTYEQAGRKMTMHYFEVPPEVLEDRVELAEWAKRAAAIAAVKEPSRRRESRPPRSG
jgi:TfoX/Sxy family transcriptional regulator of competence genes